MIDINQIHKQINFTERLNNISLWIRKAKELLFTSEHIESIVISKWKTIKNKNDKIVSGSKEPDIQGVYFMLIAYAIENICKAVIIYRKQKELKNRLLENVPNDILGHDLLTITKNIGLKLSISEQELLGRLSQNSIWAARYPVPYRSDDLEATVKILNGQKVFSAYFSPEDINKIRRFIDRLKNLVQIELNMKEW